MWQHSTLICAPVMANSVDGVISDIAKAKKAGADLVEVRLDCFQSPIVDSRLKLSAIINSSPLPILATYRPTWEGGQYAGDEKERLDVLHLAMELGASFIDVELQVARKFIDSISGTRPANCKVIVSSHNYQSTPSIEELGNLVAQIQEAGADIVKIATTALDITDVAGIFHIMVHSHVPIIAIAMGDRGLISRILCPKFGGFLTFGTINSDAVSAPGQPTIQDLLELYNFRLIGPDTKLFGVIGNPVGHSKSPPLFNTAFKSDRFNGVYVPLLVDDVQHFLQKFSSLDFVGFSCTIPHKENVLKCCDEVDPVAKSIGSANCIIRRENDGKLFCCNTDYIGAITAIEDALRASQQHITAASPLTGKLFVIIGAGGTAKAVAFGAKQKGARVVIANRTYERAKELANLVGAEAITISDLNSFHPESGMILANTTAIGMVPNADDTPISKEALKYYSLVFDAVYTPKYTRLLREAKECGVAIVTGQEMFIGQAYEQYERFTGLPAPKELFRKVMSKV